MSTGAIIFLVAILIFFLFESVSFILTIVKKKKKKAEQAAHQAELNKTPGEFLEKGDSVDDRCTDNEANH